MIVYGLECEGGHGFDSWFRDSAACEALLARRGVACPECGSTRVQKAIMAPAVARKDRGATTQAPAPRLPSKAPHAAAHDPKLRELLTALREHVEKTYDYVGERFPEEARRMHYGEIDQRDIYGEASLDEARSLAEEGVPVAPLPRPPRRDS